MKVGLRRLSGFPQVTQLAVMELGLPDSKAFLLPQTLLLHICQSGL